VLGRAAAGADRSRAVLRSGGPTNPFRASSISFQPFGSPWPINATAQVQAFDNGAIMVSGSLIIKARQTGNVTATWDADEVSLLSPHLIDTPGPHRGHQQLRGNPERYAVFRNSDGTLAVLQLVEAQKIRNFTPWTTNGRISVGRLDLGDLYAAVQRTINGDTVYMLELFDQDITLDARRNTPPRRPWMRRHCAIWRHHRQRRDAGLSPRRMADHDAHRAGRAVHRRALLHVGHETLPPVIAGRKVRWRATSCGSSNAMCMCCRRRGSPPRAIRCRPTSLSDDHLAAAAAEERSAALSVHGLGRASRRSPSRRPTRFRSKSSQSEPSWHTDVMAELAIPALIGGTAASAGSQIMAGRRKVAAAEFEQQQYAAAGAGARTASLQDETARRRDLTSNLETIQAIRAGRGVGSASPTAMAIYNNTIDKSEDDIAGVEGELCGEGRSRLARVDPVGAQGVDLAAGRRPGRGVDVGARLPRLHAVPRDRLMATGTGLAGRPNSNGPVLAQAAGGVSGDALFNADSWNGSQPPGEQAGQGRRRLSQGQPSTRRRSGISPIRTSRSSASRSSCATSTPTIRPSSMRHGPAMPTASWPAPSRGPSTTSAPRSAVRQHGLFGDPERDPRQDRKDAKTSWSTLEDQASNDVLSSAMAGTLNTPGRPDQDREIPRRGRTGVTSQFIPRRWPTSASRRWNRRRRSTPRAPGIKSTFDAEGPIAATKHIDDITRDENLKLSPEQRLTLGARLRADVHAWDAERNQNLSQVDLESQSLLKAKQGGIPIPQSASTTWSTATSGSAGRRRRHPSSPTSSIPRICRSSAACRFPRPRHGSTATRPSAGSTRRRRPPRRRSISSPRAAGRRRRRRASSAT
jgi:hypothetical protein